MGNILKMFNQIVWGVPALVLILGAGIFLTVRTGFAQLALFPKALRVFAQRLVRNEKKENGDISPYQAFCTALAATVGTGNIAGVAGAIALGGPGAVFWMWISALLGMVTKFAEATLAVRFQVKRENGETCSGPMYMIDRGMGHKWHWLAAVYCFFGVVASFGVGNSVQINAVISGIGTVVTTLGGTVTPQIHVVLGAILALLIGALLMGGAKRIGRAAEQLVPFASAFYIILCVGVLVARYAKIDDAFYAIVAGAFTPRAVTGGAVGSFFQVVRVGTSRGVFTNEAGLGTAGIAHGAARVEHPVEQGLLGIMEVFLDTIVICTLTAFAILCSGIDIPFGNDVGADLTTAAFASVYGEWVAIPIAIALILFAVATVLGWGLYGGRCAQYIFGDRAWKPYVWAQIAAAVVGSVTKTGAIWLWAETVNGLMLIPNLIVLFRLSPVLISLTREFRENKFTGERLRRRDRFA